MTKVKVYIVREDDGTYSSYSEENDLPYGLIGEGDTVKEAIDEWYGMYDAMRQSFMERGKEFPEAEFSFSFDVPSFLLYYAGKITFSGLSKLTGISPAQLSQYAHGYRKPSPKTTRKIEKALHDFGKELSCINFV